MSAIFSNQPVQDDGSELHVTTDAGSVTTVDNGAGASAVNIQDGGNTITVDGTVNVGNFPATQDVNVVSTVEVEIKNDAGNPVPVYTSFPAGVPVVTRVTVDNTAAVTLAAADSTRKRVLIHNESGNLHVKLGTGASITDYTYRLTPNTFLEVDFPVTSAITGRKAAGSGDVQVTTIA